MLHINDDINSFSIPKVTVTGLPAGLKYDANTMTINGKVTKPGTYEVKISVTNASVTGKNAKTDTFTIIVPNFSCAALPNLDSAMDAYTFGVGMAFDPLFVDCSTPETGWKIAASGLPPGLKFANGVITGVATKTGTYTVTFTATKGNEKQTATITLAIAALPGTVVGTFNGFVKAADGVENMGTFQLTSTDVGKLTAKIIMAAGTYSFSGTCWDSVSGGVYTVTLMTKKNERLKLSLDSLAGWSANHLTATFLTTDGIACDIVARRNVFGKSWYFMADGDINNGWCLSYAANAQSANLAVTFNADGSTKIAGKFDTLSVSAPGYADVTGLKNGVIYADFAPVISVKEGSVTVKRVLSIRTNLWFDLSNDHAEGIGSIKLVD